MRYALFFAAVLGALLVGMFAAFFVSGANDPPPTLIALALVGLLLLAPGVVWLAWRALWGAYGQTVKEVRRAHKR